MTDIVKITGHSMINVETARKQACDAVGIATPQTPVDVPDASIVVSRSYSL